MNNITVLYYLLSGPIYYQVVNNRERLHILKSEVLKEIEYFFEKRYVHREEWHKRYFRLLSAVFCVNLIARRIERRMYRSVCANGDTYSRFASATMLALKEYNNNKQKFYFNPEMFMSLSDLVLELNKRVNRYCDHKGCCYSTEHLIHANTPLGIELEFSNKGKTAGKFFESSKDDAMLNFSKYHYYHLTKFMWRFGAYVDAEMPFKQFIRKGGFLEYTFTRPDITFMPSQPLSTSPALSARLIEESIKFTPVKPHSLHVTFQTESKCKKLPKPTFEDIQHIFLCTGHFKEGVETRILEKNMKSWALMRDRRNDKGWVTTLEFTHMRANREFIRRKVYEPAILTLLACKNIFSFYDIDLYSNKLLKWAEKPTQPNNSRESFFLRLEHGLELETSLPVWYRDEAMKRIRQLYEYNVGQINGEGFG
jgi:hypothetical protein